MRCMARLFVCLALFMLVTAPARASVMWRGDFQSGDLSQWTSKETVGGRLTVVTDPVPPGDTYALRAVVKQGDVVYGGTRNEVDYETDRPGEGDDRYYHWQTMFPSDFQAADYWQLFTQWHQYVNGGSPPLALMVWGENIKLGNNLDHYFWSTPLVRGVWHDFIIHVKWSSDPSVGGVELWYEGQQVLPFSNAATLYPHDTVYLKQGLYRKNIITQDQTVYHAGMTVATQFSDVLPPPPPPPVVMPPVVDAGAPPVVDAGAPDAPDAGSPGVDAGTSPVTDPGAVTTPITTSEPDAGTTSSPAPSPGGELHASAHTGCSSSGDAVLLPALLAAAWLMRHRWAKSG
jgi:hypothetical protein